MSYHPSLNYATSDDTMSYFYDVDSDRFVSKIKWLDQNRNIVQIIVDATATAQEIDVFVDAAINSTKV